MGGPSYHYLYPQMGGLSYHYLYPKWEDGHTIVYTPNEMTVIPLFIPQMGGLPYHCLCSNGRVIIVKTLIFTFLIYFYSIIYLFSIIRHLHLDILTYLSLFFLNSLSILLLVGLWPTYFNITIWALFNHDIKKIYYSYDTFINLVIKNKSIIIIIH